MVLAIKENILNVEGHRQLLQNNIEKLNKTLRHWQMWEAEYEGLKEEILAVTPTPKPNELTTICEQYIGNLVTKREIDGILGSTSSRDAAQVINLLDRRIDYVERNICTLQKQIHAIEKEVSAISIISDSDLSDDNGLPLTEIVETLDDQGNVTSSQVLTPGSVKPELIEVLRKAGASDLPPIPDHANSKSAAIEGMPEVENSSPNPKKSVTFAEGTKLGASDKPSNKNRNKPTFNISEKRQNFPLEAPIIPDEESQDDATLRREMLQYGMLEIGSVVAELEVEDNSEYSSDWSDDHNEEDMESDSDEEDKFGRYTGRIVSNELRMRMIELEERIGKKVMQNISNKASDYEHIKEGIGRITVQDENIQIEPITNLPILSEEPKDSSLRGVSSVKSPDVGNAQIPRPTPTNQVERIIKSDIIDSNHFSRSDLNMKSPKLDKLKQQIPRASNGPPIVETIVEREHLCNKPVTESDEINPDLLRQEVAMEYYKMRNMMIQRQGGFMKEEESERVEFTEEEGGPKKMSRFKAARLARS